MTEQDARNPEAVGFFTAAFHYAAAHRADREGKPVPVPDDVEKFIKFVMHADATVNALWYRLLDEIFTYEKRQAELQEQIAKGIRDWKPLVFDKVTLIPREEWRGTAEQAQERMLKDVGIPPDLARGEPRFGPSPIRHMYQQFDGLRRMGIVQAARQSGKTAAITAFEKECMDPKLGEPHDPPAEEPGVLKIGAYELKSTEFEADTLVISAKGMAYLKSGEPLPEDDPQPITVIGTPQ